MRNFNKALEYSKDNILDLIALGFKPGKTFIFEDFVYTDIWGRISSHSLNLDKSCEGKIAIFPSVLNHIVYPFHTSDNYRISVSGNLVRSKILPQEYFEEGIKEFYSPKSDQKNNLIIWKIKKQKLKTKKWYF